MTLGVTDKKVIAAFAARRKLEGRKLSTDGKRLDGHWMGGSGIAEWDGDVVVINDLGSRAAQTVQRAVKRGLRKR